MPNTIIISILIPCYNEEKFIAKCLDSVLAFQLPKNCDTEILVIDGKSEDTTRRIIEKYLESNSSIQIIENEKIIQSTALNIGVKKAKGEYILRLDAHSEYPSDYLLKLYETAIRTGADNTGGIVITKPYDDSYNASLVQSLTTHMFGVGNSGFRVGMKEGPADTVPYGFFKKSIFEKVGYFDERLVRAQDYEFNRRIKKKDGKVWINPSIQLNYFNQPNIIKFLKKQFFKEAPYNAYMWYIAPYTFALRHAITAVFCFGVLTGIVLSFYFSFIAYIYAGVMAFYFFLAIISSIQQALRFKKPLHVFILPFCFFLYHFFHGMGVIIGILKLLLRISPVQKNKVPW
jgi:glycosyltransferase involved in cell wall biosynthesis